MGGPVQLCEPGLVQLIERGAGELWWLLFDIPGGPRVWSYGGEAGTGAEACIIKSPVAYRL